MQTDKCEIKYFDEGFSVKDAMKKAMEITRGERRETAFYFDADNLDSDEKVVQKISLGNCQWVSLDHEYEEGKKVTGIFHTHIADDGFCLFSGGDLEYGIGRLNILGCVDMKRNKKTFRKIDFRLANDNHTFTEKIRDAFKVGNIVDKNTIFIHQLKMMKEKNISIDEAIKKSEKSIRQNKRWGDNLYDIFFEFFP